MDLSKAADWVVPSLVGAAIYYLRAISASVQRLSEGLAVVISRVNYHDERFEKIEEHVFEKCGGD